MTKENASTSIRWDDIVFENRNKEYGAYFIRYTYSKHVIMAVIITLASIGLALAFPTIVEFFKGDEEVVETEGKKLVYTQLAQPPPIDKNQPPPPKIELPPVQKVIKFVPPKITDKEVPEEEEIPTIEEIKTTQTGTENVEGTGEVIFDEPVVEIAKPVEEEDVIFTVVEQQAEYPGGLSEMAKYLQKNLKYPAAPRRMGIEGAVFVQFIVDKDGNLSNIEVVKGIHADCDKEAIRVVKLMPPWKAGKQNGRAVKSRFVLPIRFKLQ